MRDATLLCECGCNTKHLHKNEWGHLDKARPYTGHFRAAAYVVLKGHQGETDEILEETEHLVLRRRV